jgi:ATP-dependent Clp protease ATP-binding subunit ClpA
MYEYQQPITNIVRSIMRHASAYTIGRNLEFVTCELVIMALLEREPESTAGHYLLEKGIIRDELRQEVNGHIGDLPDIVHLTGSLPPDAKLSKAVDHADEERRNNNDEHLGTGHLLLGILSVDCFITRFLNKRGQTLPIAREGISEFIKSLQKQRAEEERRFSEGLAAAGQVNYPQKG